MGLFGWLFRRRGPAEEQRVEPTIHAPPRGRWDQQPAPTAQSIPPVVAEPREKFRFVALDVETANGWNGSICQIGLAFVSQENTIQTASYFVNPEVKFAPFNTGLHGIDANIVRGAPAFRFLWPKLVTVLERQPIVQHSTFDEQAVKAACEGAGLPVPNLLWIDSVRIARQAWPELKGNRGHGLAALKDELKLDFRHHDAAEDARAAAMVVLLAEARLKMTFDQMARGSQAAKKSLASPKLNFRDRAPTLSDPVPEILGQEVVLVESDDNPPSEAADGTIPLESYFSMIEYRDTRGAVTRRRVTMSRVELRATGAYLIAFCHERNATRTFRTDRLICLISQDGEILDGQAWFRDTLGFEFDKAASDEKLAALKAPAKGVTDYTAIKRKLGPAMTLLIAAARSDDKLQPQELQAVMDYFKDEARVLRDEEGVTDAVAPEVLEKLERTLRRLRPTRSDVENALGELLTWSTARKKRLSEALARTVRADGKVDEFEADLLAELDSFADRRLG